MNPLGIGLIYEILVLPEDAACEKGAAELSMESDAYSNGGAQLERVIVVIEGPCEYQYDTYSNGGYSGHKRSV